MKPDPAEFAPLAYFPFDVRPESMLLTEDECATALYLDSGRVDLAAARLKVLPKVLRLAIRRSLRLQRLIERLAEP